MSNSVGSGAPGSSDCEEEDQEDSSSSSDINEVDNAMSQVQISNDLPKVNVDELSVFRQQWQRELESSPSPQRQISKPSHLEHENEDLSDEDKAKKLFLRGVEMERGGKLYEAIQHYKRAIQILPDVETLLYEGSEQRPESSDPDESQDEVVYNTNDGDESDDEGAVEGEDLLARLQRILAKKGQLCQPNFPVKGCHISWLPYEVIQLIVRWVVSSDLDAVSLERVAGVCRGLYVTAREQDIWRSICVKTWGIDCGSPRAHNFASWRQMYIERPRLNLNGCYISKTTYLRHGENSFQDHFYRPWYLVEYYRYLSAGSSPTGWC
ncbi:F-box only protein 9 isoform X2 [Leptidea sinapis]|uniref:F-box only protein 9 isoform X2 n=1 Tax=Leptidea sinapis TaxID=189913 RepID=UPI0021C3D751|nr:F-box only protein 9 isoform X2 [Leptidea sinapis]